MLEIHAYRIRLGTLGPLRFDGFPGVALRGALGEALGGVRFLGATYARLFRPTGEGLPRRFHTPPPPLVLRPRFGAGSFGTGSTLELDVTLCGVHHRDLPALLGGLVRLGEAGIGEDRRAGPTHGTFEIQRVQALGPAGPLTLYSFRDGFLTEPPRPWVFPDDFVDPLPPTPPDAFTIELRSPTLLDKADESPGAKPGMWSFAKLIRSLSARISVLSIVYGERHLLARDEAALLEVAASRVRERDRCCALQQVERYSTRQRRSMVFGGWTGYVSYEGSPESWLPLLRAAALLHVGRHCTFGWGEVRLHALEDSGRPSE